MLNNSVRNSLFLLLFLIPPLLLHSLKINYQFIPGTKYKVEAHIEGEQSINSAPPVKYNQYYKTITSILENEGNGIALLQDDGYYYITNQHEKKIKEIKENILVKYHKDKNGLIFAPMDNPFPVMRNIPYLPDIELRPGVKWESDGTEMQDFFGDNIISQLPVKVYYEFKEVANDTQKTATILYTCIVHVQNKNEKTIDSRILEIQGRSDNVLYFSLTENRPVKEVYRRDYSIKSFHPFTKELTSYDFQDRGERIWSVIKETLDKAKEITKIEEDIQKKQLEDVKITQDSMGLKLSLENIQFEPDSAILTHKENERLKMIADILSKYKGKQIRIIGHTTDRGTQEGRTRLSLERAKAVGEQLLKMKAIEPEKAEVLGKGGAVPLAPNDTLEGQKKNRRVEIYILDE